MAEVKNIGMAVVSPVIFNNGGVADKNGNMPIMLRPVAGKLPNRFVISGTVAANEGFEVGQSYLIDITEREADAQYGRQFQYRRLMTITSPLELVKITKELGQAVIFDAAVVEVHASEQPA